MKKFFAVRLKPVALVMGSIAGFILLATGTSFAAFGPVASPGETVDVFTLPSYGTAGFTITLSSTTGGGFVDTIPLTYVGQITGNFTPNFARNAGINWGTAWDEFSFKMPSGGTSGHIYSALINTSSGGAVFTRFVGYPGPSQAYGTEFTYEVPATPPAGQTPEVPYAAAVPLVGFGTWGVLKLRSRRSAAVPH